MTIEINSSSQEPYNSCFGGSYSIHPDETIDPDEYKFCFQFKSPNSNIFSRIFLLVDENNFPQDAKIFNIDNSKILELELEKTNPILKKIHVIKSWNNNKELPNLNDLCDITGIKKINYRNLDDFSPFMNLYKTWRYQIDKINQVYYNLEEEYYKSEYLPYFGVKFGGTPVTTQLSNLKTNWWQLTDDTILTDLNFGDSGISHIYEDGYVHFDCC